MENKIIRVRCIDNCNWLYINKGEVYEATEKEYEYSIKIAGQPQFYPKRLFEEVKEDVLIVECIDNEGYEEHLIIGNKYPVKNECEDCYYITDEVFKTITTGYKKNRFKPVPKEKEMKINKYIEQLEIENETLRIENNELRKGNDEQKKLKQKNMKNYNLRALIENIHQNEKYECGGYKVICLEDGTIEFKSPNGNTIGFRDTDLFTKVEEPKPVTTSEAMKALEEGKIIESCRGYHYKKEEDKISIINKRGCASRNIDFEELQGKWIIL